MLNFWAKPANASPEFFESSTTTAHPHALADYDVPQPTETWQQPEATHEAYRERFYQEPWQRDGFYSDNWTD